LHLNKLIGAFPTYKMESLIQIDSIQIINRVWDEIKNHLGGIVKQRPKNNQLKFRNNEFKSKNTWKLINAEDKDSWGTQLEKQTKRNRTQIIKLITSSKKLITSSEKLITSSRKLSKIKVVWDTNRSITVTELDETTVA
jgi:DNA anti-recombination protein RmuC